MLKRKITEQLHAWKQQKDRMPLVIKGCRQCGKTYSALQFANEEYKNVIYINFYQNPDFKKIFEGSLLIDDLIMYISAMPGVDARFVPGETVLILDEIQECAGARTSLKFWKMDGRYDVIATGSLLGVRGYGPEPASVPVGYETVLEMYPMSFEEFLWANGIEENIVDSLRRSIREETLVPEPIHSRLKALLLQYTVVGGMPAVVQEFVTNRDMGAVLRMQKAILEEYKEDMVKYASAADKPLIKECFESIPRQLAKENKKFQYSVVRKNATASRYMGSIQWVEDAGITTRCYNLQLPELPLDGNAINDVFKIYMADTGLFVAMLEDGTQLDILQGNLYGYKGAIFENLIAETFRKNGRKLYYYHKDSGLEIDFVIRQNGRAVLVEVKATTGNTKSSKTILNHPEKYHVSDCIKLGDYNVGREGAILTLPHYMAFLI